VFVEKVFLEKMLVEKDFVEKVFVCTKIAHKNKTMLAEITFKNISCFYALLVSAGSAFGRRTTAGGLSSEPAHELLQDQKRRPAEVVRATYRN
jgi:hypothetical protein